MAPWHEPVQTSLITTLGAAGRKVEALSVFRAVRARLADDLGLDPGRALETAHRRVLSQDPISEGAPPTVGAPPSQPVARRGTPVGGLVGRVEELALLRQVVVPAFADGAGLAIVEGEPGVGKTRLLEEIAAEADRRHALIVWGRCLSGDGTPSMWPWVQTVSTILDALPADLQRHWLDSELGRLVEPRDGAPAGSVLLDSGAQFRLFERVAAVVTEIAARRAVVLIIDDLHWADLASLQLFAHLAARLPGGAVLIGALRDRAPAPGTELARMLAAASRVPGHRRILLGPLDVDEVAELVRRESGREPDAGAARRIHARTAGNPYFVRELSRFHARSGSCPRMPQQRRGCLPPCAMSSGTGWPTSTKVPSSYCRLAALIGRDDRSRAARPRRRRRCPDLP